MNVFNFPDILVVGKVSSLVRLRKGGEGVKTNTALLLFQLHHGRLLVFIFLENEIFDCAAGLSFALSCLAFAPSLDD